ncbi:Short-chain dehydrogenase TIC 32, chloroplastic [Smittium mucronatum]|uniref:Short-chain dehydrogenase TIC 32, chloroplastic n=1 Tax=Smittium mucronatum TaxID=133383 RepID=A0A1R0H8T3_9FUNG|nr:Short-chain dehydrogenase TIC 32, chloroplastic [Smittium mucronatum]
MQFGTNYVGHFKLTNDLIHMMYLLVDPRVVFLSSNEHYYGKFENYDFLQEKFYDKKKNYSISKLCCIMFANELSRRHDWADVVTICPGPIDTDIDNYFLKDYDLIKRWLKKFFTLSVEQGSLDIIYAALSENYSKKGRVHLSMGSMASPLLFSKNEKACKDLWKFTEKLILEHSKSRYDS